MITPEIKLSEWTLPLHFKGDVRNYDPDTIMGPNADNEFYRPVGADFDPESNRTTLHCALILQETQ